MSLASAQSIIDDLKSDDWKKQKAHSLKKYGKLLSLPELKQLSIDEGVTLYDKLNEWRWEAWE